MGDNAKNNVKSSKQMTEEERTELAGKLDKELDDFLAGLEKRSYTEGWPEDRWEEEMEKHPFFMKKLPEDGSLPPLLEGIQQLKYDENENTPLELATSYKEDGNFNFKCKNYRMAIISYTEGIRTNCGDNKLESQLYGNRAASQFFLENYRSSLIDCQKALKKDPNHVKVKIRAAQCCIKLKMFKEAMQYCDEILQNAPDNSVVVKICLQAQSAQKIEERNLRRREYVEKILQLKREAIKSAIEKRNIQLDMDGDILESLKLSERIPVLEDEVLSWPVNFIYLEHGISDFIEQFNENSMFKEHLDNIFVLPAPWDPNYYYRPEDLSIYFEDLDKTSVHSVGLMDTLSNVLKSKKFFVQNWTLSFFIFVSGSKSEFNYLKSHQLLS